LASDHKIATYFSSNIDHLSGEIKIVVDHTPLDNGLGELLRDDVG
jgi:hypothetical protein